MITYIAAVSDENIKDKDFGPQTASGRLDDSQALEIHHEGSYEFLGNAWSMGMMHLQAKKQKQKGFPFEMYWNNPKEVSPEELKSSVYFPIKS